MTREPDVINEIEANFAVSGPQRLAALDARAESAEWIVALEVRAKNSAQRAVDALARGDRDQGVLNLVCALITTEEIDHLEGTHHHEHETA